MKMLFLLSVLLFGSVQANAGTVAVYVTNVPNLLRAIMPVVNQAGEGLQKRALYIQNELKGEEQKVEATKLMNDLQTLEDSVQKTADLNTEIQIKITTIESKKPRFSRMFARVTKKSLKAAGCTEVGKVQIAFDVEQGNIAAVAETANCDSAVLQLSGEQDEEGNVNVTGGEQTCAEGSKLVKLTSKKKNIEYTDVVTDFLDGSVCVLDPNAPKKEDPRIKHI